MSRIAKIKAAQLKAKAAGDAEVEIPSTPASNRPLSRMHQIKQLQQQEAEETGIDLYVDQALAAAPESLRDLAHYQTALDVDIGKIAAYDDLQEKANVKQSVLPTYLPFVDAYVESGDNYPNTVAVQCMIWLFDIFEIEHALNLALHLVKQAQIMPNKFSRNMPSFVCDTMYDIANALLKDDKGISPYLDHLIAVIEKDKWDVPVVCISKLYSIMAKHKMREGELEQALALCNRNIEINPEKHGVKGLKADIEKQLKAQANG